MISGDSELKVLAPKLDLNLIALGACGYSSFQLFEVLLLEFVDFGQNPKHFLRYSSLF
jgi:hypothetical protein